MASRGSRAGRRATGSGRGAPVEKRYQILIFSEGVKTEEIYFNHWIREYRDRAIAHFAPHTHTDPPSIVRAAADRKRRDSREEKRGKGKAYDEYWCVIDEDEHPDIPMALNMANDNGIRVALSAPCLELWFLIHYEKECRWLHRQEAQSRAYKLLACAKNTFDKTTVSLLAQKYDHARDHAQHLQKMHQGNGTPQPWNPGTDVWRLIETMRLGRPLN